MVIKEMDQQLIDYLSAFDERMKGHLNSLTPNGDEVCICALLMYIHDLERRTNAFEYALQCASDFIDCHVADPDLTEEMVINHSKYNDSLLVVDHSKPNNIKQLYELLGKHHDTILAMLSEPKQELEITVS